MRRNDYKTPLQGWKDSKTSMDIPNELSLGLERRLLNHWRQRGSFGNLGACFPSAGKGIVADALGMI